ncbi:hypothetical protein [Fictibacillus phosphorivorans]|uniref:hypothetical protein n=1 Tax=Fictibacillus phosphorivorans TaxID=1221500 RepID=UPI002040B4A1|nr:hypothetical protein [Fictibacillus phosphorivorans]MCM3718207.1 hypothetical protein [Fictibacillus phosphorivorans]MCM3775926.1 hypothetical protein [Fictibacillus phosphorivorans]
MQDPLKQLPEILNNGRMKNITFKEEQRHKVLQKLHDCNRPPAPKSWFYHWFHQGMSLALGIAFIFLIIQFAQGTPLNEDQKTADQLVKIPYANKAILTKARHDMRHHYDVTAIDAYQEGDTLFVHIIFPDHLNREEQINLTKSYLKEVSHLTLNEPYVAQEYLGELWNYVNVKIYTAGEEPKDGMLADKLQVDFGYDWLGTIDKKEGILKWDQISD